MVAMCAAHGERYVVKKMVKAAPQYQPYSVKSQGKENTTVCSLSAQSRLVSQRAATEFFPPPEQQLWQLRLNIGSLKACLL